MNFTEDSNIEIKNIFSNEIFVIIWSVLNGIGSILNVGVIMLILFQDEFQSLFNTFFLNLFLCDLVLVLNNFLVQLGDNLNLNICKIVDFITFTTMHGSYLTLIFTGLERYISFARPLRVILPNNRICVILYFIIIWSCAVLMTFYTIDSGCQFDILRNYNNNVSIKE